jgi:hypothetical protein
MGMVLVAVAVVQKRSCIFLAHWNHGSMWLQEDNRNFRQRT